MLNSMAPRAALCKGLHPSHQKIFWQMSSENESYGRGCEIFRYDPRFANRGNIEVLFHASDIGQWQDLLHRNPSRRY